MQEGSGFQHKIAHRLQAVDEVGFVADLLAFQVSVETAGNRGGGLACARVAEEVRDLARRGAEACAPVEPERTF
jgi:methyl-accepting chemotaxis protein